MIKFVRIDHRLIHGQVAFSWTNFLGTNRIIVIDTEASLDEFRCMALNMSKPAGVKLNIYNVAKAIEKAKKIDELNENVMLVFGSIKDTREFVEGYPHIKEINLGGVPKKEGSKEYGPVVYLTLDEEKDLKKIAQFGTILYMQQLPTTKKEVLNL